jgi:uncharacterized repeat protein (TIGR01451 family)
VTYEITLENKSSDDTPDLECTVTDLQLDGFSESVTLTPTQTASWTVPFTIPVGANDPFTNTAEASCSPVGFPNVYTFEASWGTNLFQPGVEVEKTGPEQSKVGDDVTYTVTISNTSSGDSPDLILDSVEDTPMGDLTDLARDNGCDILDSDTPESCTFTYTHTVQSVDPNPLVNTVTVEFHPLNFTNVISDTDDHSVELFSPLFEFEKTGDRLSKIGDEVNYTLTLSNTTATGAPDLQCTIADTMLNIDETVTLPSGEEHVINKTYTVPEDATDPYTNTAEVTCSPVGFDNVYEGSASHTVNLFQPAVQVVKTGDTTAMVGDTVVYDFTITNIGSNDSPDLILESVTDTLLGDLTDVAADNGCGTLAPQDSCSFQVEREVVEGDPNPLTNTVTVLYHPEGFPNDVMDDDPHAVQLTEVVVGGATLPFNWAALLAPWLALVALLLLGGGVVVWRPGARK